MQIAGRKKLKSVKRRIKKFHPANHWHAGKTDEENISSSDIVAGLRSVWSHSILISLAPTPLQAFI